VQTTNPPNDLRAGLMRSLLFIPGNRPDMLQKALRVPADAFVPDMEDSVRTEDKALARATIRQALPELAASGRPIVPRVNTLSTGLTEDDINAVIGPYIAAISIGKIRTVDEMERVEQLLSAAERRVGLSVGGIQLLPWLETASAVVYAVQLLQASTRICFAAFGADDFAADMGILRTQNPAEIAYPRAALAVACRAAGVTLLDSPCVYFKDLLPLEQEIDQAQPLGIKGKFAIHPAQVPVINRRFGPTAEQIAQARRIVDLWRNAPSGRGALNLDGTMVDEPLIKQAEMILRQAEEITRREPPP
jgi:citrate lyase subunit beta/citryl-CoA lyase